jgi:hypothetical protein
MRGAVRKQERRHQDLHVRALNWCFPEMTRKAGIGHWHAPETVHRHVIVPQSKAVATVLDSVFGDD